MSVSQSSLSHLKLTSRNSNHGWRSDDFVISFLGVIFFRDRSRCRFTYLCHHQLFLENVLPFTPIQIPVHIVSQKQLFLEQVLPLAPIQVPVHSLSHHQSVFWLFPLPKLFLLYRVQHHSHNMAVYSSSAMMLFLL